MDNTQLQIVISAKNELEKGIASANASLAKLGQSAATSNEKVKSLGIGSIAVGTMLGGIFTQAANAVFGFGKSMIKAAGEFEQTKIAFTTMLGSAEKANTLLRDLSDFAMKTPFTLVGIEQASKQLLAYGFGANEIVSSMKMLGDVASGVAVPLNDLAYVYGTLRAQGRAFTMDIRQFAMRGIPIYEALSKTLGVSTQEIQKMVSEGKVGFKEVENAFKSMTGEGGKFNDLMKKQSETLMGRISNVDDAWTRFLRTQGSGLIVFANMAVDALYKVLDWLNKDAQGANYFGKTIYGLIKFFVALGKTVWSIAKIVAEFIAIGIEGFISLGRQTVAYAKDFINAFKNIKNIGLSVFQAFGKAITGDFKGAAETIKRTFSETFSNTISESSNSRNILNAHLSSIGSEMGKIGSAWSDFATLDGFETAKSKFGDLGNTIQKDMGGAIDDSKDKTNKLKDAFDKMTEKLADVKTKGLDSLDSIGAKITELTTQLQDLYNEQRGKQTEIDTSYGDEYVKQEQKVAEIQAELKEKQQDLFEALHDSSDGDIRDKNDRIAAAQKELQSVQDQYNKETASLQKYSYIAIQYANQVKDARITASNTEFENAMVDLQKKQDALNIEFAGKKAAIEAELKAEVEKYNQTQGFLKKAFDAEKDFNNQSLKATVEKVNAQIDKYNALAEAIQRAASGKTSSRVSAGTINQGLALANSPYQVTPINITINASNVVGSNAGKELGNLIMNTLKDNVKVAK